MGCVSRQGWVGRRGCAEGRQLGEGLGWYGQERRSRRMGAGAAEMRQPASGTLAWCGRHLGVVRPLQGHSLRPCPGRPAQPRRQGCAMRGGAAGCCCWRCCPWAFSPVLGCSCSPRSGLAAHDCNGAQGGQPAGGNRRLQAPVRPPMGCRVGHLGGAGLGGGGRAIKDGKHGRALHSAALSAGGRPARVQAL